MVSNATEEANLIERATTGKSKQRKVTPSGRRSKSSPSNSCSPKEVSPTKLHFKNVEHVAEDKSTSGMGNSQYSGERSSESCKAKRDPDVQSSNHTHSKESSSKNGPNCMISDGIKDEIDELQKELDDFQNANAEIARLKRLHLLQVSLISRQQDLLRLRDREIMQLKASNANYKCQLNRVRRRMSKRRSDGQEESPKSSKRRSPEGHSENLGVKMKEVTLVSSETQTPPTSSREEMRSKSKKRRLEYPDGTQGFLSSILPTTDVTKDDTPGPSHISSTPDKDSIPVPISFIEQVQKDLVHTMVMSPPNQELVKTFCDITGTSPSLSEVPLKICDRCPHCVAFAQEIRRLLKTVETFKSLDSTDFTSSKEDEKEILKMAGITSQGYCESATKDVIPSKKVPILRTSSSFHRIPPTFDQNHWWWDLKCDTVIPDKTLKIPTWKVHEIPPLIVKDEDVVESCYHCRKTIVDRGMHTMAMDDQTFMKRHLKLEMDEKRRKKWDIQRIREYRYNEKLRQKLLKQAEYVEVEESLPVNVFGYPIPHMDLEEFDLSRMWDSTASCNRRRAKKL